MFTRSSTLLLPVLVTGCVATAVYGSARPLAPGAVQTAILVEQGLNGKFLTAPGRAGELLEMPVPGPGLEMRFGLRPGMDVGARLSSASGLVTDLKIAVLERGDLAVSLDPALGIAPYQYVTTTDVPSGQASLRVLGSWRVVPALELSGHATLGGLLDVNHADGSEVVATWGAGLGPLFRLGPSIALQPSGTLLWRSDRAPWHPELALGLGLILGREAP